MGVGGYTEVRLWWGVKQRSESGRGVNRGKSGGRAQHKCVEVSAETLRLPVSYYYYYYCFAVLGMFVGVDL